MARPATQQSSSSPVTGNQEYERALHGLRSGTPRAATFPSDGQDHAAVVETLRHLRANDIGPRATFADRWLNDRGLLLDDGAFEVAKEAYLAFFTKNNSYPPVMELERNLVTKLLDLFRGEPDSVGCLTSGGSESLFLATASALAAARKSKPEITRPEIVIPETGYPTFTKYARYLGYKLHHVAVDKDFRADPHAMQKTITKDTVMMLASMPSWAHGACDPVPELGEIASDRGIWLHVDACVGGLLAPFVRDLGRDIPPFDFGVPGVQSISADLHKYGYSAKGVSGVFYRSRELARDQSFVFDNWAAGLYRSPVFTGTRSGGAIASAWSVVQYLGRDGYCRRAAQILKLRDALVEFAAECRELRLLGRAELSTVAIGGNNFDIHAVGSALKARGWMINFLKDPQGLQFVLGPLLDEHIECLVSEFRAALDDVRRGRVPENSPPVVYSDEILEFPTSSEFDLAGISPHLESLL